MHHTRSSAANIQRGVNARRDSRGACEARREQKKSFALRLRARKVYSRERVGGGGHGDLQCWQADAAGL